MFWSEILTPPKRSNVWPGVKLDATFEMPARMHGLVLVGHKRPAPGAGELRVPRRLLVLLVHLHRLETQVPLNPRCKTHPRSMPSVHKDTRCSGPFPGARH